MQYMTIQKNITSSPRKLRLVADVVRNMRPMDALTTLKFTNKAAAVPLSKAIKTVLANSGNREDVFFQTIEINEGPKLKRFRAGSRGHADPYTRRWSHIKIVLSDEMSNDQLQKPKNNKKSVIASEAVSNEVVQSEVVASEVLEPEQIVEAEEVKPEKMNKTKKGGKK